MSYKSAPGILSTTDVVGQFTNIPTCLYIEKI